MRMNEPQASENGLIRWTVIVLPSLVTAEQELLPERGLPAFRIIGFGIGYHGYKRLVRIKIPEIVSILTHKLTIFCYIRTEQHN